jgi:hypothetical protein
MQKLVIQIWRIKFFNWNLKTNLLVPHWYILYFHDHFLQKIAFLHGCSKSRLLFCCFSLFYRLRVRRSNFMRLKFIFSWGRIHEIKFFGTFHEIKIPNNWFNLLIAAFFMRSKFKKSIIRQFWSHDRSCD